MFCGLNLVPQPNFCKTAVMRCSFLTDSEIVPINNNFLIFYIKIEFADFIFCFSTLHCYAHSEQMRYHVARSLGRPALERLNQEHILRFDFGISCPSAAAWKCDVCGNISASSNRPAWAVSKLTHNDRRKI